MQSPKVHGSDVGLGRPHWETGLVALTRIYVQLSFPLTMLFKLQSSLLGLHALEDPSSRNIRLWTRPAR